MKVLMEGDLKELYLTGKNRNYKEIANNQELMRGFIRAVHSMMAIENTESLKQLSYLHYEKLRYQLSGLSSVRLSNRYVHRLIFSENNEGIEIKLIEIDNTHYGNKQ